MRSRFWCRVVVLREKALSSTCQGTISTAEPKITNLGRKMSPSTNCAMEMATTEMPTARDANQAAWRVERGWSGIPKA